MRQVCCFFNLASSLPPPNMSKVIQVMFEETQQKDATRPRAVLVLDVSDSMKDYNRLKTLKEAVDGFLLCLLDNVLELAIVTFSSAAEMAFGDALGLEYVTTQAYLSGYVGASSGDHNQKRIVINMLVMSQVRHLNSKPIVTLCEVSEQEFSDPHDAVIFVDVSKGDNVVLDASVMAMVINTQGLRCPIRLRDDGHDPDIMKHDGTYSGYFTQFTGQGRYSVMAYVDGDQKTRHAYRRPGFPPDAIVWDGNRHRVPSNEVPIRPAPANYIFKDTLLGDLEPTQPFQRVTGGASFKVTRTCGRVMFLLVASWTLELSKGTLRSTERLSSDSRGLGLALT
ncbi:hypothetical protein HPB49_012902 [Dermacentor silvarum]|uniref:Uncharacterized protein n=1 Tax=Dermacentor silvarum TaxID=543639 RepID=A0ACB8DPE7_DERSI|nr:hypothetical protein HPB49_012902 [Dermacentor silvarum]